MIAIEPRDEWESAYSAVPAARWHPWRVPHVLLGVQDIACAGCRSRVCPIPDQPCIGTIEVDDVVAAVASLTRAVGAA